MQERELIKQIKQLRRIKPNKDWVCLTKKEILGEEKKEIQVLSWLFAPIKRPAFVLRGVVIAAVFLAGTFFYMYYLNSQVLEMSFPKLPIVVENQANTNLTASLTELQASLKEIKASLNNLKKSKDPRQALAMTEVVKAAAKNGKEMVREIKTKSSSNKVLATLNEVENSFKELGERSTDLQREMIRSYLEDLKQRTLTEEDRVRLQKAEEYYNQGKDSEAMILLMRIGSNNN